MMQMQAIRVMIHVIERGTIKRLNSILQGWLSTMRKDRERLSSYVREATVKRLKHATAIKTISFILRSIFKGAIFCHVEAWRCGAMEEKALLMELHQRTEQHARACKMLGQVMARMIKGEMGLFVFNWSHQLAMEKKEAMQRVGKKAGLMMLRKAVNTWNKTKLSSCLDMWQASFRKYRFGNVAAGHSIAHLLYGYVKGQVGIRFQLMRKNMLEDIILQAWIIQKSEATRKIALAFQGYLHGKVSDLYQTWRLNQKSELTPVKMAVYLQGFGFLRLFLRRYVVDQGLMRVWLNRAILVWKFENLSDMLNGLMKGAIWVSFNAWHKAMLRENGPSGESLGNEYAQMILEIHHLLDHPDRTGILSSEALRPGLGEAHGAVMSRMPACAVAGCTAHQLLSMAEVLAGEGRSESRAHYRSLLKSLREAWDGLQLRSSSEAVQYAAGRARRELGLKQTYELEKRSVHAMQHGSKRELSEERLKKRVAWWHPITGGPAFQYNEPVPDGEFYMVGNLTQSAMMSKVASPPPRKPRQSTLGGSHVKYMSPGKEYVITDDSKNENHFSVGLDISKFKYTVTSTVTGGKHGGYWASTKSVPTPPVQPHTDRTPTDTPSTSSNTFALVYD